MTFIKWSLIHLYLEYDVDTCTLFPARREKKCNFVCKNYLYMLIFKYSSFSFYLKELVTYNLNCYLFFKTGEYQVFLVS